MYRIDVEDHDGTLVVTLDHPPYNTVFADLLEDAALRFTAIAASPPERGVVLTSKGSDFTRGMDTKIAAGLDREGRMRGSAMINAFAASLHRLPCAFVCAVNGHAIGAGGIVLLTADWVVAAEGDYRIGLPEAKAGLPFPAVPQAILDHWLDPVWRRRLALSSRLLAPADAVEPGLVDELVAPEALVATAVERAQELSAQPAFAVCKRQLRAKANAEIDAILGD